MDLKNYKRSVYNIILSRPDNTYLFNTLSGTLVRLDSGGIDLYNRIGNGEVSTDEDELFHAMLKKGIVVEKYIDEVGVLFQRTYAAIYSLYPESVSYTIVLTNACNYSCFYCFENNAVPISKYVDIDQVTSFILNQIRSNQNLKNLRITWFGGEPLLYKEGIIQITERILPVLDDRCIRYSSSIITNGYFLDLDFINKLDKLRVSHVQITLDGTREYYAKYKGTNENAFNRVLTNLAAFVHSQTSSSVGLRMNCDKENLESVFSLLSDLEAKGYFKKCEVSLAPINSNNSQEFSDSEFADVMLRFYRFLIDKGYIDLLKKQLKRSRIMSCGYVGNGSYIIDSDGTLKKCERHMGVPEKTIGDLIHGKYYNDVERQFQSGEMNERCLACDIYPLCRGGCKDRMIKGFETDCSIQRKSIMDLLNLLVDHT